MQVGFLKEAAQASRPVVGQLRKLEEVASGGHCARGCPAPSPAGRVSVSELRSPCHGPRGHPRP